MILALLTMASPAPPSGFKGFQETLQVRYGPYIRQPLTPFEQRHWYLAVKPYHAGMFPFLALDLMAQMRGLSCHLLFAHDLLPYSAAGGGDVLLDEGVTEQLHKLVDPTSITAAGMTFKGFGNRIDIGLNAISLLYMEILRDLTRVECSVLTLLRELQFDKYRDPLEVRTFGLQKQVAARLGKSPVAVHKSLRSAKYPLLAETATSMKNMMV